MVCPPVGKRRHPTRSVLSKPHALLSLCAELREGNDGRAFRRRVQNKVNLGSGALVSLHVLPYPSAPQEDDVYATVGATSAARDGQRIPTTMFISSCRVLGDTVNSLPIRSTPTRTIYELVPCRERHRLKPYILLVVSPELEVVSPIPNEPVHRVVPCRGGNPHPREFHTDDAPG